MSDYKCPVCDCAPCVCLERRRRKDIRKGMKLLVTEYWLRYYADKHCTICGNKGIIDSTGIRTPAGIKVGRLNYCICPNGQSLRNLGTRI